PRAPQPGAGRDRGDGHARRLRCQLLPAHRVHQGRQGVQPVAPRGQQAGVLPADPRQPQRDGRRHQRRRGHRSRCQVTFSQLALANVRGSWLRYAAFFLSSTFSVMLFYLYAQFVLHPDLASGYLYGGESTRTVLVVCMVLIVIFAFFFVLYSSGAFLRARNQEFGLLTLMGTTRRQLRRLIWLENTFLSLASIAAGIGLGILFSRLFLLAISRFLVLVEPMRFVLVPQALLLTAGGFFLLFQF